MKNRLFLSLTPLALALIASPAFADLRVQTTIQPSPATVVASAPQQKSPVPPSNYVEFGGGASSVEHVPPPALKVAPAPVPAAFPGYVTQNGKPADGAKHVVASGSDVLLSDAFKQLLPKNFILVDNSISMRKLASWTGGRSWVDVLADLGRAAGFVAHIDWNNHQVSLAPAPLAMTQKESVQSPATLSPAVKEVREIREVQLVSSEKPRMSVLPVTPVVEKPVAPPINTWTLDPAMTLQENIQGWAKKAGWTVVWEAVDYPVFAKTTFQGDFAAETGPLAQVFAGYADSDQPLLVRLTSRDRVVYVRNRILDRADVSPLSEPIPDGSF